MFTVLTINRSSKTGRNFSLNHRFGAIIAAIVIQKSSNAGRIFFTKAKDHLPMCTDLKCSRDERALFLCNICYRF